MSKRYYLITLLLLTVIGTIAIWQFRLVTRSAVQLTRMEIIKKIDLQLQHVSRELKRVPNSDQEFALLVLGAMDFPLRFPRISIHKFTPGSRVSPAFFQVCIRTTTTHEPLIFQVAYYGCEYQANLALKGSLRIQ